MTRFTATEMDADGEPHPVLAVLPDIEEIDEPEPERQSDEYLRRLLRWLAGAVTSVEESGRRMVVAAHVLRIPGAPATVRDLGKRLGMSKSRAGQLRLDLCREIGLLRAKTGQRK